MQRVSVWEGVSTLNTNIIDGKGTKTAATVTHADQEANALVVATRPLKTFENAIRFFTSDNEGIDMNVDASSGGTPELIHDGIDNVYWTGTTI